VVAVYEHGFGTAAGGVHGICQSSVSTALVTLRLTIGDPLFVRVGHGMHPTARMRGLIDPVREALSRVNGTFTSEPVFNASTTARTFTLAMSDLGEIVFMPKILRRIRQLAPRASVRSVAASAAQTERGLETGEVDLAVGYFPDLREKSFAEKHLFFHHFVCLLRANHPISASTLSMSQFLSVEHAVVYGAGRTYEIFERYLKS